MKKKCVFFDADGTILDIEKGVPEETKLAIKNLIHNGHRVFCVQEGVGRIFQKKWKIYVLRA